VVKEIIDNLILLLSACVERTVFSLLKVSEKGKIAPAAKVAEKGILS
jgi:hypothetical protein